MALWSVRLGEEMRSGLTVYQLQDLIRTGQVAADAEVSEGTEWKRVVDVPMLARSIPSATETSPAVGARTVDVLGVTLELDENGKPKPLPPDVIAKMLASQSTKGADPDRIKKFNRGMLVAVSVLIMLMMILLLRQMNVAGQILR